MSILHITNGGRLTKNLVELNIPGEILTWDEMLCEGPTTEIIDSESFLNQRKTFFSTVYGLEFDAEKYYADINKLNTPENYTEIILWFEQDLFCYINLIAVISLLQEKKIALPLYLVSSGKDNGHAPFKVLDELSQTQLLKLYDKKIQLTAADIDTAVTLWRTYCGKDHNLLKLYIKKTSSFLYLSNCLKAHLERFPETKSGLSVLEFNILKIIKESDIKSKHHLLGYILNYQGFYGFGTIQINRLIEELALFFDEDDGRIQLNRKGHVALLNQSSFASEINNNMTYGGVYRLDYQFSKQQNKLIKTPTNAN